MSDYSDKATYGLEWHEIDVEWLLASKAGRVVGAVAKHQNGRVWSAVVSFRGEQARGLGNYLTLEQAKDAVWEETVEKIKLGHGW